MGNNFGPADLKWCLLKLTRNSDNIGLWDGSLIKHIVMSKEP